MATGVAESPLPDKLEVLWKFNSVQHGFEATAVIVDGLVYAGSLDGNLYVLSLADGKERWRFHTELGFSAAPAVADGRVFAGDSDGKFYCLDAATGKPLWGFETNGEIDSGANFYQDKVLFGSQDATLYCLEAATGKLAWKYTIGDQVRCSPTVVDGRAFLAGCDGKLHIIDLEKGEAINSVEIDAPTGSTTGGGRRPCILWHGRSELLRHRLARGQDRLAGPLGPQLAVPLVGRRHARVGDFRRARQADLCARPGDGRELWKFATKAKVDSSPVVVGNRVFVGSSDGRLYSLDRATGKLLWDYEAGGHFVASPAVAADRLVIGNSGTRRVLSLG